jgi:hypothetical protein
MEGDDDDDDDDDYVSQITSHTISGTSLKALV